MPIPETITDRYRLDAPAAIASPALLVYLEPLRENLRRMLEIAGSPGRLRPHVKTHKMPAIVRLQVGLGITKHKCATIAEAEMLATAGARDVLLAYQPVGPNVERFLTLMERFPGSTFRVAIDDVGVARALSEAAERRGGGRIVPTLVDLDVGMGRTGIDPDRAGDLYEEIDLLPGLEIDGLHAYDGHSKQPDLAERRASAKAVEERVARLLDELIGRGLSVPRIVLGGTPPFAIHAESDMHGVELSPGTCTLQDVQYGRNYPDLPFEPAALLLGRVISRPRPGRLCLDLGHKAVAADPSGDRVALLGMPGAALGPQSEEHLVVETPDAEAFPVGTVVLAIPTHVCPTCACTERRSSSRAAGSSIAGR